MTNFVDSNSFEVHEVHEVHDDYYTPKSTWELIVPYIENVNYHLSEYPKIWEMCLLNSNEQSKEYLDELLPNVIIGDKNCNCLLPNDYEEECDMIITNPPFDTELKKQILKKLVDLDKPFIIILNSINIFSKYFHEIFADLDIKYIIPSKKLHFDKYDGEEYIESKKKTYFYSIFVTYKITNKNIHL